ncbi:sugar phosphate isomerase/epimerase [Arthrobacter sp. MI7-26]|uniref:sugar phosphate isomerase/epimerase family protein n=1 Tax=Arthrobacter sp. MI7-26 TaxID=2993653 RepID=UPI0022495AA9|nr:sugar phosphate isomerase/epimerase family protein [Arthrobacter sp. MI7-26]MCX2750400.1 sugar phosphate isomerase/epimerase [Arthrobacter sp. MI7-26]
MKIGVDGRKIPGAADRTPVEILDYAKSLGMDGVYFRTVLDITPTLDRGLLREVREQADALGLYLQMGLAKVNPYAAAEAPEVRVLGDGDYTRGMLKMMEACREGSDCGELWVACGNYKAGLPGYYANDRFRTDAPWPDQLAAIEKFLRQLAPAARDLQCHLNIETHEEITSTEVVRLVEAVGPDVLGITFDTANVLARGEDPVAAARRVAPYVRAAHLRDSMLAITDYGLGRVFSPCGLGVIDWEGVLGALWAKSPNLCASIEPAAPTMKMPIGLLDEAWLAVHPDLEPDEPEELFRLARVYDERSRRGMVPTIEEFQAQPYDGEAFIRSSAEHLRASLAVVERQAVISRS